MVTQMAAHRERAHALRPHVCERHRGPMYRRVAMALREGGCDLGVEPDVGEHDNQQRDRGMTGESGDAQRHDMSPAS